MSLNPCHASKGTIFNTARVGEKFRRYIVVDIASTHRSFDKPFSFSMIRTISTKVGFLRLVTSFRSSVYRVVSSLRIPFFFANWYQIMRHKLSSSVCPQSFNMWSNLFFNQHLKLHKSFKNLIFAFKKIDPGHPTVIIHEKKENFTTIQGSSLHRTTQVSKNKLTLSCTPNLTRRKIALCLFSIIAYLKKLYVSDLR